MSHKHFNKYKYTSGIKKNKKKISFLILKVKNKNKMN